MSSFISFISKASVMLLCSIYSNDPFEYDAFMINNFLVAPTNNSKIRIYEFNGSSLTLRSVTVGQHGYGLFNRMHYENNKLYCPGSTMTVFNWNNGETMSIDGTFSDGSSGSVIIKVYNNLFYVSSPYKVNLIEEVVPPPVYNIRYDNITTIKNQNGSKHLKEDLLNIY